MKLEAEGVLIHIGNTEQVSERFRKRQIVIRQTSGDSGQYSETVPFDLVQDKCEIADRLVIGQRAKVHFNLKGREHNGKYYAGLQAWRVEQDAKKENARAPSHEEEEAGPDASRSADGIPF